MHVFFFRGLSTYGPDYARWSALAREFQKREIKFYPVLGMGAGSLAEVAARARQFVETHPVWRDGREPIHFLGHSAGGLIARLLEEKFSARGRLLSCVTVATPHAGSHLAEVCVNMPSQYPGSHLILRTFGYNVIAKQHFFQELTRDRVSDLWNLPVRERATTASVRIASIVCSSPRREWCAPLKAIYFLRAFHEFTLPSDGVVERDSQPYGEVIAELNIDHFRQVGLFGQTHRFAQMCEVLGEFFHRQMDRA